MMEQMTQTETPGLSQIERLVDTFIAPTKTFTDILRSTSWWLPFLLTVLATVGSTVAIDQKVGFVHVAEQTISQTPSSEERMAQLSPQQRAAQMNLIGTSMKVTSYASGIIVLIFVAVLALINWASFNFGLGAKTTYGQNFAVAMYGGLPRLFVTLLNIIFVYAGVNTESFNLKNPVGTNLGYYLTDAPNWLQTALSFFDVFGLWTLALMVIGMATISGKSKAQSALIVVGWWVVGMLVSVGIAAAQS